MTARGAGEVEDRGARDVRRAWGSFGLFAPSLVGAFVTGEGLLTVLGYDGEETVPVRIALTAGVPALVVFALPALLIAHLGRQAISHGHPEGRTPMVVAWVVAGVFVVGNLLQLALAAVLA